MSYQIDKDKCVFCSLCETICLFGAIVCNEEGRYFSIDSEKCKGCGQCSSACGNSAIFPSKDHVKIEKVEIDPTNCIGCSICLRNCPALAPYGEIKKPFTINQEKCLKCGFCAVKCPKKTIIVTYADKETTDNPTE